MNDIRFVILSCQINELKTFKLHEYVLAMFQYFLQVGRDLA